MSCCGGVDVVEDVRISPTINKVIRDMYYRDKNYIDVREKIANRNFEQNTVRMYGRTYYKIPGHNTYVLTNNGRPNGKIVEISKLRENSIDVKYLVRDNQELMGNITKTKKKIHRMTHVVYDGEMRKLEGADRISFEFHNDTNVQSVTSKLNCIIKQTEIDIRRDKVDHKTFYSTPDYRTNVLTIDTISRDGVSTGIETVDGDKHKRRVTAQFLNSGLSTRRTELMGLTSYDQDYDIILCPTDNVGQIGGVINIMSPSIGVGSVVVKFTPQGTIGEFIDERDNTWKKLDNNKNLYQFDKQLRSVLLADINNDDFDETTRYHQQATYKFILKLYGLDDKVRAIELDKQKYQFERDKMISNNLKTGKRNFTNSRLKVEEDNKSENRNENIRDLYLLLGNNTRKSISNIGKKNFINRESINSNLKDGRKGGVG